MAATVNWARRDALKNRDLLEIRSIPHAFRLMAGRGSLSLGNDWELEFSTEFLGFVLTSDKYNIQFAVCPVSRCPGGFNGGWYCEHFPSINDLPQSALFRNHIFNELDYARLKAELSEMFGLPFSGTAADTVVRRLKKLRRPIVISRLNVSVETTGVGSGIMITLLDSYLTFHPCSTHDCLSIGSRAAESNLWKCETHFLTLPRLSNKEIEKYKNNALARLKILVKAKYGKTGNLLEDVLHYLRRRGKKGKNFKFVGRCKINIKVTAGFGLQYRSGTNNYLGICIRCGKRCYSKTFLCSGCESYRWKINIEEIKNNVPYGGSTYIRDDSSGSE